MRKLLLILIIMCAHESQLMSQETIFFDDFESGTLNNNHWKSHPGTDGIVDVASTIQGVAASYRGTFGVALGKSASGGYTTNRLDLHLDLSGYRDVQLSFWIKDNNDGTDDQDGIWFSDDGGERFKKVYAFSPAGWSNQYGQLPPIDVDGLAADSGLVLTSNFVIRFQQYGWYNFQGGNGLFLDNVLVVSPKIEYASLPFMDDFETGSLGSAWSWSDPTFAASTTVPGTVRPDGVVAVVDNIQGVEAAHQGLYGVAMGKRAGTVGGYTSNSLDLHLDLSAYRDVQMRFWIKDNNDGTDAQDGIWFSNDGGKNFKKVYDFIPSGWSNQYGQLPPLDVDELASANGLALTSTFVIRFQQYGWYSFQGGGSTNGFLLDDILVTSPQIEYATLPFSDGFESGSLGSAWSWSDPTFPVLTAESGTVRPEGIVAVVDNIQGVKAAHQGFYGAAIGKRAGSSAIYYTSNALDLRLDLSGQQQVELSFWLKHNRERLEENDGIFYSPNGGRTFRKIYSFEFPSARAGFFDRIALDLDSLITAIGLSFSANSVIRFQQCGFYSFQGSSTNGLLLDDISAISSTTTEITEEREPLQPIEYSLSQNHPNPFNPATQISFALSVAAKVTLRVFDLAGKEVATLVEQEARAAGVHEVRFDARYLPSGVYLYRLQAGDFVQTRKMLLVQ